MEAFIKQKLSNLLATGNEIKFSQVSGGYINKSYCISSSNRQLFCKINSATKFPQLLSKEKNSLEFLSRHTIIKTPKVIDCFEIAGLQVLVLEWICEGERTENFWKKFGEQLATLHFISNTHFGREESNYMGSIPQTNHPAIGWIDFFTQQRIGPLVKRCRDQKLIKRKHLQKFEKICQRLAEFFDEKEKPSLLHGDLWKGNFMCNENSEPVLIDPSVYFGHHSIDLGMTTLYNAFPPLFYEAYDHHFPLPPNYREQWEISNLYVLLVSLSIFGKALLPPIEQTLKRFA